MVIGFIHLSVISWGFLHARSYPLVVPGLPGEIRMAKLDVEGADDRGYRGPEVTGAANQGMGWG